MQTSATQRQVVRKLLYARESEAAAGLLEQMAMSTADRTRIAERAGQIVTRAREQRAERGAFEIFLQEFGLSTDEGIALLSLAEALLRVPDSETADNLIAEKIAACAWNQGQTESESALVNMAARALGLASNVVQLDERLTGSTSGVLHSLVNRVGAPVVRTAIRQAMRFMGGEFVLGRTIEEALDQAARSREVASFDMLGEGARTGADAQRHLDSYFHCFSSLDRE